MGPKKDKAATMNVPAEAQQEDEFAPALVGLASTRRRRWTRSG